MGFQKSEDNLGKAPLSHPPNWLSYFQADTEYCTRCSFDCSKDYYEINLLLQMYNAEKDCRWEY